MAADGISRMHSLLKVTQNKKLSEQKRKPRGLKNRALFTILHSRSCQIDLSVDDTVLLLTYIQYTSGNILGCKKQPKKGVAFKHHRLNSPHWKDSLGIARCSSTKDAKRPVATASRILFASNSCKPSVGRPTAWSTRRSWSVPSPSTRSCAMADGAPGSEGME